MGGLLRREKGMGTQDLGGEMGSRERMVVSEGGDVQMGGGEGGGGEGKAIGDGTVRNDK